MKKIFVFTWFLIFTNFVFAQSHSLVGYWQNWNDSQCPYIPINQVDTNYNVIAVAFAIPLAGTTYNMQFTPDGIPQNTFIQQINSVKATGKKVIISIGGQNHPISLNNTSERDVFINTMMQIINTYNFDGLDIDIEGQFNITGGTIANPVDSRIINMINAVKTMMTQFRNTHNKKMFLSMAPETANLTGGISGYGGIWGSYLPLIYALKDSIDIIQMQLYNSGSMYGIDGRIYIQGTTDFICSQTEAVIRGFNTAGGMFPGLRADQVAVGLPACSSAAGGGYIIPDSVKAAIKYLRGMGPKPSTYTTQGTYNSLRGMMTWSVNWDNMTTCHPRYAFANNYASIFNLSSVSITTESETPENFILHQNYPNPFNPETKIVFSINETGKVKLNIYDISGKLISQLRNEILSPGSYFNNFNAGNFSSGVYIYELEFNGLKKSNFMTLLK